MAISRLGLVGKGRWGSTIKKTILEMRTCELAYEVTRDWKILLEKDDIDGIIIATPPATHTAIALPFIERNVPVFIEKPMASSIEDAKRIEAAAQKSGTSVMVGHIHLYNPAFLAAKELARTCGPIRLLIGEGANNGPFREDYSALWDWAPHDLSMILDVLGEQPLNVQAWAVATTRPGTTLWDSAQIKLVFPSGAAALISSTWLSPEKRKRLTIIGEESSIVYDDALSEKKVALYEHMGPHIEGMTLTRLEPAVSYPSYDTTPSLNLELQAFVRVIAEKEKPRSGVAEGLAVVRILEAAEKSIATNGQTIQLEK